MSAAAEATAHVAGSVDGDGGACVLGDGLGAGVAFEVVDNSLE